MNLETAIRNCMEATIADRIMLHAGARGLSWEETLHEVRGYGYSSAEEVPESAFPWVIQALSRAADLKGVVRA